MSELVQVVCPHDDVVNRLPAERLQENPKCGKCHQPLFSSEPVELTEDRLRAHLADSSIPVLVDFWAPWCGPCLAMAPAYKEAARTLEPNVRLVKVDTDRAPQLAARYGIRSIPTLILFSGGQEVARQSGAMPAGQIVAWTRARSQGAANAA